MTFNEQFFDASVRHQIDLLRFGSGVARKVNGILDETRADLRRQVERRLGKVTGITGASLKRLRELERAIDQTRSGAWNDVTESWTRTAVDVALEEPLFMAGVAQRILPVELDLVQPSAATLRALATSRPFHGKVMREWAETTQRADLSRIHSQIRIGMVQGESSRDIAARVFGARGAMNVTRAQVEAVTRTAINHVSNAAQREFLQENADLFDVEQYVATLDMRTSPQCRALDGKRFPVGKGPIPPVHYNCRSIRVAALNGEVIGERPFKAGTEQQMLREYAAANGLGKMGSRDDLPKGHKNKFDQFSRRRMRELTGQVPAKTTYQEWLAKQPAEIQDDILGPTRGKLFREGGLTLDRFVNREGDELTLDELRRRNREAFERAGLGSAETERQRAERERAERAERDRQERERLRIEAEARARREAEAERQAAIARQDAERARRAQLVAGIELGPGVNPSMRDVVSTHVARIAPRGMGDAGPVAFEVRRGSSVPFPEDPSKQVNGYYDPLSGSGKMTLADRPGFDGKPHTSRSWSIGEGARNSQERIERLITHEYGHHLHMRNDLPTYQTIQRAYDESVPVRSALMRQGRAPKLNTASDPEMAPSIYGAENKWEFWAESFAAWHHEHEWLRQNRPIAYKMVEDVLALLEGVK